MKRQRLCGRRGSEEAQGLIFCPPCHGAPGRDLRYHFCVVRLVFLSLPLMALPWLSPSIVRADEVDSHEEYIVNGHAVAPDGLRGTVRVSFLDADTELDEITAIALRPFPYCSGVLIAPTVVLTAAHCLEDCSWDTCSQPDGETAECLSCKPDLRSPSTVYVTAGVRTVDDLRRVEPVAVREVFVPEDYTRYRDWRAVVGECEPYGDDYVCTEPGLSPEIRDLAVLLLDTAIESLTPVPLLLDVEGVELSRGIATGYGERTAPGSEALLDQDEYDSLLHETSTPIERVTEREILTDAGENESGICYGDSGSPLYVQRGNQLFVAGVASRLRFDREPPKCGKGAIYSLTDPYASWIFEVAPEATPFRLHGGGGCSVSLQSGKDSAPWLLGLVLIVFFLPVARRRRPGVVVLFAALSSSMGCGSGGEPSLCTERYDPLGVACNPEVARADLHTAEVLARAEVPEGAWLWEVRSSYSHMDPDGNATDWALTYYLPQEAKPPLGKALEVYVRGTVVDQLIGPFDVDVYCVPTRPIEPFDSRKIIHDTIRRIEETGISVQMREPGDLGLVQNHRCASPSLRLNGTSYRLPDGFYYVGYDEYGEFLEVRYEEPTQSSILVPAKAFAGRGAPAARQLAK